jgi:hypothetical protein
MQVIGIIGVRFSHATPFRYKSLERTLNISSTMEPE